MLVLLLLLLTTRVVILTRVNALDEPHLIRHHRHREEQSHQGVDMGGPQCPPSVRPISQELCEVKRCYSHSDCHPDPLGADTSWLGRELRHRACCYNGCVYSCMRRMPPPAVFDWLEETPDYVSDTSNSSVPWNEQEESSSDDTVAAHVAPPDVVALPGGCVLTHSDFLELQGFEKSKYVEKCYCNEGEVFCKFEHSNTETTAS